ncbi:hypothetical protein BDA99DRAFT_577974 [Phascolomyces articulosus]|uniref:Isopenicillin N synthase-like Fe(2+) 2OG dioxygenase domain-containing protein n=1 Tax=Phascolomyces articulosus TaxID=60185 RepID=A0AAD5KQ72_9FUNG|nr:hypothetical protein BDA99DRAFT_577974 [Phascolomyces articulosus]
MHAKMLDSFQMINNSEPSVPQIHQAFELSKTFFTLLTEEKVKYTKNKDDTQRGGYLPPYSQRLDPKKQKENENKETFQIIPSSFQKGTSLSYFPTIFQEHNEDLGRFSKGFLSPFVLPLNEITDTNDYLILRHPYDDYSDEDNNALLSFVIQAEIYPRTSDGDWITAPVVDNAILVNIGGMLEAHTKGLLKAANHRVMYMPEQENKDRYSIGYFVSPAADVDVSYMPSPVLPTERIDSIPKDRVIKKPSDYRNYRTEYYKDAY